MDHCTITGALAFADKVFPNPALFQCCDLGGEVDLTHCRFLRRVEFIGCCFKQKLKMTAAEVNGDCELRAVVFEDHVDCDRLVVKGKLENARSGNSG